jgi:hypothetical protein
MNTKDVHYKKVQLVSGGVFSQPWAAGMSGGVAAVGHNDIAFRDNLDWGIFENQAWL